MKTIEFPRHCFVGAEVFSRATILGVDAMSTLPSVTSASAFEVPFRSGAGRRIGAGSPLPDASAQSAFLQGTRTAVAIAVENRAAGVADRILRGQDAAPAQGADRDALFARLDAIDPELTLGVQALLNFLDEFNPRVAEALAENLDEVLHRLEQLGLSITGPDAGRFRSAPTPDRTRGVRIALEATVTRIQAQVDGGIDVSAEEVRITLRASLEEELGQSDPLVLDLDGNGRFDVTTPQDGHRFDLLGTGSPVLASTVTGGDGLLALDRNGNGLIDDGTELFGDQNGSVDGFAELARFDDNGDHRIDAGDRIFDDLLVFRDENRNGATDSGELQRLAGLRISALLLDAEETDEDANGNAVVKASSFEREDGSSGRVGDLLLNYLA